MQNTSNEGHQRNSSTGQSETTIDVKEIVRQVNELADKTIEKGSLEIGDLVLGTVFKGDLSEALSHNPQKHASLTSICQDPDSLVRDRKRLGSWVKAAAVRKALNDSQVDCSKLKYSHFAALLKVSDEAKRQELAAEANKSGWSVRDLNEKIDVNTQSGSSDGRAKALMKKVEHPLELDEDTEKVLEDPKALEQQLTKSEDRLRMAGIIDKIVAQMAKSTNLLKRAKRNIAIIELGDVEPEQV